MKSGFDSPNSPPSPRADRVPPSAVKDILHPRNRHRGRYDFPALTATSTELASFVRPNPYGDLSIDFADPKAVKALNRALLAHDYGVLGWDVPAGYLCPPIPGRADYLHYAADLLGECQGGAVPRGESVSVIDVGVGANCVYPIIGLAEYGWHFLGTDIDRRALESAAAIAEANPALDAALELRLQPDPAWILRGIVQAGEEYDLTICNPPFHASLEEAQQSARRKWTNLGRHEAASGTPQRNFGGQGAELWCEGGEIAFLRQLVRDSERCASAVLWFSSLVSKEDNLPRLQSVMASAGVVEQRVIGMGQGQKKNRLLAWTYYEPIARRAWAKRRWA